jgi:small GTP-binding protein
MTTIKLCCVGATGCGKTSFMLLLKDGAFPEASPAAGEIKEFNINMDANGTAIEVTCTDTGSSEQDDRRRPMMKYASTDIFLACFSYADPESLKKVPQYVKEMLHHSPGTPIFMVGFKSDLDDKTITQENIDQVLKTSKTHVGEVSKTFSVSCKTNQGVQELMKDAAAAGLKYRQSQNPVAETKPNSKDTTTTTGNKPSKERRSGCTLF